MSLFTKRKGRRISSFEDDDEPTTPSGAAPTGNEDSPEPVVKPIRFGKRPTKQSALRRSINIHDFDSLGTDPSDPKADAAEGALKPESKADDGNDDDDEPAVVRPSLLARSSSRRKKNRLSTASTASPLSFGGGSRADDDNAPAVVTPKREKAAGGASLTQRVLETNAFRKSLSSRLPTRQRPGYDDSDGDDDDNIGRHTPNRKSDYDDDDNNDDGRPRYSQAYLDELQNSTPNTPVNLSAMQQQVQRTNNGGRGDIADDADLMDLDPSELDGAMLVDASELHTVSSDVSLRDRLGLGAVRPPPPPPPPPAAHVLTETEIQERKDRRARRALEQESISLGASDDEQAGYISLLTDEQKRKRKAKESTRLVREDEDLGEGFDEFVEDKHAPLALGKKAEREARRRRKQEMADLISAAAGPGPTGVFDTNDSDDSEAERRAAYDAAQTRAGMDGLHRAANGGDDGDGDGDDGAVVHGGLHIPKMMSTLPDLSDCLQQMQSALHELEVGVAQHRHKLAEVDQEKAEITARETEVQRILDAAAAKYQAILGGKNAKDAKDAKDGDAQDAPKNGPSISVPAFSTFSPMRPLAPGQSPLRALPPGLAGGMMPVERGLESLGTTPTRRPQADDYF